VNSNDSLVRLARGAARTALNIARHPRAFGPQLAYFKYQYYYPFRYNREAPFREGEDGFGRRRYRSEDDYFRQQRSKLAIVRRGLERQFEKRTDYFYEQRFARLFAGQPGKAILCLGARDGVEVRALRRHGLLAIGIDIAYPENTPYVHYGDFHHVPYPDGCFDFVYTNCFDHMLQPEQVLAEARRVLKPGGQLLLDLPPGEAELDPAEYDPGTFEAFAWKRTQDVVQLVCGQGFAVDETVTLPDRMTQALFTVSK
jgi:SAM-dependent methyltransferase